MSPESARPNGWPSTYSAPQLALDFLTIVSGVADAAFAVDEKRRIVSWNRSAEQLFGVTADRALGRCCHEVIRGRDVFGNVFCRKDCNVALMVREGRPVRRFELDIPKASGGSLRAALSVLSLPAEPASAHAIVHVVCGVAPRPARGKLESSHGPETPGPDPIPATEGLEASTGLTCRETEVLALLSQGASTAEIAEALDITVNTVRTHVEHILQKLGVHSKLEAVSVAHRDRLL